MAEGMYYAVICAEDGDFDPRSVKYDGIRPRLVKGEQEGNETFVQVCRDWNVRQLGKQADEPVSSDLPVLILNGRFDPITPETYGEMVAQTLPNSVMFTFPNTGHGAIGDACADQVMAEFLDDPARRPEAACLKEAKVDFITSQDVLDLYLPGPFSSSYAGDGSDRRGRNAWRILASVAEDLFPPAYPGGPGLYGPLPGGRGADFLVRDGWRGVCNFEGLTAYIQCEIFKKRSDEMSESMGENREQKSQHVDESWREVGRQFEALGSALAQAFRSAWTHVESKPEAQQVKEGLESMVREVGQAIEEAASTQEAQKVKEEAKRAVESLRVAGEQTVEEVRPQLLTALKKVNEELQKLIEQMDQK